MKRIYTFEEAFEASKKYFNGDELAARVWVDKYALKDKQGNIYESTKRVISISSRFIKSWAFICFLNY